MNRTDRPLDLDAIEAQVADSGTYVRVDLARSLIAEVRRLQGEVDHRLLTDWQARNFAWAEYREDYAPNHLITAHNAFHAGWEAALSKRWVAPATNAPQPDPLDENDHRDRVTATGIRIRWNGWHWCEHKYCKSDEEPEDAGSTLYAWQNSEHGPLAFADDPQTPPQVTSATETALNRAALAEVAEQAHRLSQAICDLLDGER